MRGPKSWIDRIAPELPAVRVKASIPTSDVVDLRGEPVADRRDSVESSRLRRIIEFINPDDILRADLQTRDREIDIRDRIQDRPSLVLSGGRSRTGDHVQRDEAFVRDCLEGLLSISPGDADRRKSGRERRI